MGLIGDLLTNDLSTIFGGDVVVAVILITLLFFILALIIGQTFLFYIYPFVLLFIGYVWDVGWLKIMSAIMITLLILRFIGYISKSWWEG